MVLLGAEPGTCSHRGIVWQERTHEGVWTGRMGGCMDDKGGGAGGGQLMSHRHPVSCSLPQVQRC